MSTTHAGAQVIGRLPRITEPFMVGDVVRKTLEQDQPLTVLRAARGFGKTGALVSWLRSHRHTATALYYPLDRSSNEPAAFWSGLGRVLVDAGLIAPDRTPASGSNARTHVLNALGNLARPLRLVLDNMHEAGLTEGAAEIDNDLIELVRNNDQFYLVAAGRTLRTLETVGSLSVDAGLVGPADLRLTAQQVQDLAVLTGVSLTRDQAQQITEELGGWPAAIRAGLRGNGADGAVDEHVVRGYIGAVVSDLRCVDVRTFLLRTAVPESFDVDLLRAITPSEGDGAPAEDSAATLVRLRAAGILQEERTPHGTRYRHPAAIRRALLQVMRESAPEIGRQVHRELLTVPGVGSDPGLAVVHAIHAEEWATALDLIDRQWFVLLTQSPQALADAVQRIPARYGQHDPRVRVARQHLAALVERISVSHTWAVPENLLSRSDVINDGGGATEPADEESLILVQWGAAAMLGGHHDAAIYAFSQARELGLGAGTMAATLGASGVALVHALDGEPDLARAALDDAALRAHLAKGDMVDPGDLAAVAVRLAEAMIAIDAGHPDASVRVSEMVVPRNRTELWVVAEFARAHYAAFADDPEEVFREANKVRAALRHVARRTLADAVLQSVLVELLLIARMVGVAGEVADQLGQDAIAWIAQAKVHNARQNYDRAVHFARQALAAPGISKRSQLEATVIMASALHAQNNQGQARVAFHSAVRLARATGQRRPFQLMHRYVFDVLAEHIPQAQGLWPGTAANTVLSGTDRAAELPTLTMREAQVLRALERHAGPVGIGRSLDLSVNTVKTHLRSIYRKLGVASRNEALEMAGGGRSQPPGDL